jgi:hypothetical protein
MFVMPARIEHDFINTGTEDMKLFTVLRTRSPLKSNYRVEQRHSFVRGNWQLRRTENHVVDNICNPLGP